jgi:hypothetical protein
MANNIENNVHVLSNQPLSDRGVLCGIAEAYMIGFGNDPEANEGAIRRVDGTKMALDRYMDCLIMSARKRGHLENVFPNVAHPTKDLQHLITWLHSLPENQRTQIMEETSQNTGGFTPYYNLPDVLARFERDLTPRENAHPIAAYWGDKEYSVAGFLTGIVCDTSKSFLDVTSSLPYLTHIPDIRDQFESFLKILKRTQGISFPTLFELEGVVIPERRGAKNGTKWNELLLHVKNEAKALGASHSTGVTFEQSRYYTKGQENRIFTDVFRIQGADGLLFFVSDLDRSIVQLQTKLR